VKLIINAFLVGAGIVAAGAMQTAVHQHGTGLNSLSAALQARAASRCIVRWNYPGLRPR
jgi:hypothetical protein